jgi:hypothetical protein
VQNGKAGVYVDEMRVISSCEDERGGVKGIGGKEGQRMPKKDWRDSRTMGKTRTENLKSYPFDDTTHRKIITHSVRSMEAARSATNLNSNREMTKNQVC